MNASTDRRSWSFASALLAVFSTFMACHPWCGAAPGPDAKAGVPQVIRTMTHHQVTALDKGLVGFLPVVSAGGNRIVFGAAAHVDGQPARLAIVDFDGGNLHELDDLTGVVQADVTADGFTVVYAIGTEIRSINADGSGRRTVVKFNPDGAINCVRISGDGRAIVFLTARGLNQTIGDKILPVIRGVYAVNPDGSNLRRVAGPDEAAPVRGVKPDDVGNPNLYLEYPPGTVGVSHDGSRVVFGCWVKGINVLFGCDGDGQHLHTIMERHIVQPGLANQFISIALSGDGSTIAYHAVYTDELGAVGFDGKNERALLKSGPDDHRLGWPSSAPIYVSADGAHVLFEGRYFNADGSGSFQLLRSSEQGGVLRYLEYESPAMDANGRRFAYWGYEPRPFQLATMELNVPWEQLRGAPRISDLTVDPASIPRIKDGVAITPSKIAARALSSPMPALLTGTAFRDGCIDPTFYQWGATNLTDMSDDGKADSDGDAKAGDGIYSGRWVQAAADAPDGPRSLRVEAQITGADKRFHASVVEIGPFPVVDGSAPPLGPVTLAGTPPPPPTASNGSSKPASPTNPPGPVAGSTGPPGPVAGPIDLTGYWKTDLAEPYFIRQIGEKVYWSLEGLPRVRNIFMGAIDGGTLSGTWVDLPGGSIETGIGTLTLKVESNDKLTKTSSSIPYGGSVWTRTTKPADTAGSTAGGAAGSGGTSGGTAGTIAGGGTGAATAKPWEASGGQACFEKWIALTTAKLNAYDGGAEYNRRKPYSINQYGILEGTGIHSAFAPDGFKDHGNNRYWFMWDYWVPAPSGWTWAPMNAAEVPGLRDFVTKCQGEAGAEKTK